MAPHLGELNPSEEHVKLSAQADAAPVLRNGEGEDADHPSYLTIDPSFVVPPDLRPSLAPAAHDAVSISTTTDHIPVIDLAPLHMIKSSPPPPIEAASTLEALAAQVAYACAEWGFFQVINHGVSDATIQNLKDASKAFFELPMEKKQEVKASEEHRLGYHESELTRNVRDWKEIFDMAPGGSIQLPAQFEGDDDSLTVYSNQWPSSLPSLRNACEEYVSAVEKLSLTILELLAQSLGLPPSRFHKDFKSSALNIIRLLHYPVCPVPNLTLGVNGHKDTDGFTILLQDEVGGLEVRRKDGQWISVKPDPQALVINVGDAFQVYSNDKYYSVEHRVVVNANKERYSFPFFFNPAHWVELSPVSELIDEDHPPRYIPFNWGKYIKRRLDTNRMDFGVKNLEISHYRLGVIEEGLVKLTKPYL